MSLEACHATSYVVKVTRGVCEECLAKAKESLTLTLALTLTLTQLRRFHYMCSSN